MLIMHIGHISRTQSFQQNRHIFFHALVALKLLVSLISRPVACSARIVVDRQTDRQTDTQANYCNPRCACAPRVKYKVTRRGRPLQPNKPALAHYWDLKGKTYFDKSLRLAVFPVNWTYDKSLCHHSCFLRMLCV